MAVLHGDCYLYTQYLLQLLYIEKWAFLVSNDTTPRSRKITETTELFFCCQFHFFPASAVLTSHQISDFFVQTRILGFLCTWWCQRNSAYSIHIFHTRKSSVFYSDIVTHIVNGCEIIKWNHFQKYIWVSTLKVRTSTLLYFTLLRFVCLFALYVYVLQIIVSILSIQWFHLIVSHFFSRFSHGNVNDDVYQILLSCSFR